MKSERSISNEQHISALVRVTAILFSLLLVSPQTEGSTVHETTLSRISHLRPGDVLLVPLNCYVCNAIEKETGVPYSHSVVVGNSSVSVDEIFVYEAWGSAKKTNLTEILARAEKKTRLFLLRPTEFATDSRPTATDLSTVFENQFKDAEFDDEYLWNNSGKNGTEKLYCSEFVVKFVNTFLKNPQPPLPMSFAKLNSFWKKYYAQFDMEIPEGEPGASPATLFASERYVKLGELAHPSD